jgi:PEP-CTERM motif
MRLKFFAKTLVAAAVLASAQAHAATANLGVISGGAPTSFNAVSMPAGPFSDIFTFSIASAGAVGISAMNFPVSGLFNTVFTSASLFSNPDGLMFNADDSLVTLASIKSNAFSFLSSPVGAGSYYLNVSGIANGPQGGLYNGSLSVAAVPEPQTYAMLLAGVGVMAFIARRRNKTL